MTINQNYFYEFVGISTVENKSSLLNAYIFNSKIQWFIYYLINQLKICVNDWCNFEFTWRVFKAENVLTNFIRCVYQTHKLSYKPKTVNKMQLKNWMVLVESFGNEISCNYFRWNFFLGAKWLNIHYPIIGGPLPKTVDLFYKKRGLLIVIIV